MRSVDFMKYAAVIFDLFGTLVEIPSVRELEDVLTQMASVLSVSPDDFIQLWRRTSNRRSDGGFRSIEANIKYIGQELGVYPKDTQVGLATEIRFDYTRRLMTPRPDAVKVLSRLKLDSYKIGLISDCSVDVPVVWDETPFVSLIDVAVFSCSVCLTKPDARIYHLATEQLAIQPKDCLYIGDGNNQELSGALEVGMHPVLILNPNEDITDAHRPNREEWHGPTISSLKDILTLVK